MNIITSVRNAYHELYDLYKQKTTAELLHLDAKDGEDLKNLCDILTTRKEADKQVDMKGNTLYIIYTFADNSEIHVRVQK